MRFKKYKIFLVLICTRINTRVETGKKGPSVSKQFEFSQVSIYTTAYIPTPNLCMALAKIDVHTMLNCHVLNPNILT